MTHDEASAIASLTLPEESQIGVTLINIARDCLRVILEEKRDSRGDHDAQAPTLQLRQLLYKEQTKCWAAPVEVVYD